MLGFYTGLSALNAAQAAIRTIGHNLANRATPGYARERVILGTAGSVGILGRQIGTGVGVEELRRLTDETLETRLRTQSSIVADAEARYSILTEFESLYGGPLGSDISERLGNLFGALTTLAATPADSARQGAVVQAGVTLAEGFRRLSRDAADLKEGLARAVEDDIEEVNRIAESLAEINERVTRSGTGGVPDPSLLDRRAALLAELSSLAGVKVRDAGAGKITVTLGGRMLVSTTRANRLTLGDQDGESVTLRFAGTDSEVTVASGRLAARLAAVAASIDPRREALDALARTLILNVNRVHATGVPESGGFSSLRSEAPVVDISGNGSRLDETLRSAGLPFDVREGSFYVNVEDTATGATTKTRIDVNPYAMTVGGLIGALDQVEGLTASLDPEGRLRITAAPGRRFDFSNRLNPTPDTADVFGSQNAVVAALNAGPYALSDGSSFQVSVDGGPPQTVTFTAAAFGNIGSASAGEVAAAINAQINGATASVVDGRVVLRSASIGESAALALADGTGSPLLALGLAAGTFTGSSFDVNPAISGTYTGTASATFTFRALGDGEIGATAGLEVGVFDAAGNLVGTLEVGDTYTPGTAIEVKDGISVSFGPGRISGSGGGAFTIEAVPAAAADTSDVLAAFGLNSFFSGSGADDIAVVERLVADPKLLAGGEVGGIADSRRILDMLGLRGRAFADIGGRTFEAFQIETLAGLGSETARARDAYETQETVLSAVSNQRDRLSGVSTDEELLLLQESQETYQAAARFIDAVGTISQILVNLGG